MLRSRVTAELRLKLVLSVVLTVGFCLPYFLLQRWPVMPIRALPVTPVDRWIPFEPAWVWAYQSIYLLMPLPAWLAVRRADLRRYAIGFAAISAIGFTAFALYPVASPQPAAIPAHHLAYRLLRSYDGTLNCFPSLHAALAVFACLSGWRTLGPIVPRKWRIFGACAAAGWVLLILYATLATKQHWAVDLPAGVALGWLVHRWMWRKDVESTDAAFSREAASGGRSALG